MNSAALTGLRMVAAAMARREYALVQRTAKGARVIHNGKVLGETGTVCGGIELAHALGFDAAVDE